MTDQKSKLTVILILALGLLWATGASAQLTVLNTNVPAGFGQAGFIQAATLDATGGGTLTMNGVTMIVPANSVVQFPANTLRWADLFDPTVYAPIYDPGLGTAPTNLSILCATAGSCTGLALADNINQVLGQSPYLPFNAIVLGNIDFKNALGKGAGAYIVGLILPIGQDLGNGGAGVITCIDYLKGRFEVGGTLSTAAAGACGATPTGTVIEINDPTGRYGWAHSPDPRWSVDPDNPTIAAGNGYPMCLPKVAPPTVDPDCPIYNRPLNLGGDPFLQPGAPLMVVTMPAKGHTNAAGDTTPDPWKPAPLMVGDYLAYAGVLLKNNPAAAIDPTKPWNQQTYISANTVGPDKVEIITAPCPAGTAPPCTATAGPAYMSLERMVIGTGGTSFTVLPNASLGIPGGTIPLAEPRNNIVVTGFVTDSTNLVDIFAVDINPANGAETHRLLGTVLPEPGFPGGRGNKGRFRFDVGKGNWGNRTRVYMAQSRHGTVQVPTQTGTIHPDAGLLSGQYHAPMFTFQFADAPPGFPIIPQNFDTMPFLTLGEGGNLSNGPLTPFPPFCARVNNVPTCQP
jgi:hypothetical protein